jgi:hypothetical protein
MKRAFNMIKSILINKSNLKRKKKLTGSRLKAEELNLLRAKGEFRKLITSNSGKIQSMVTTQQ